MATDAMESAQEPTEPKAPPAPQVSAVSGDKPGSSGKGLSEVRFAELLEERDKRLLEQVERLQQSTKDRRFARLEKGIQELRTIKARLEDSKGDWSALEREATENEYLGRLEQLEARLSGPDGGSSWDREWATDSERMLKQAAEKYGVILSPAELASISGRTFETRTDAFGALNDVILAKARGEEVPAAAIASEGGATPAGGSDVEALLKKTQDLKARGASKKDRHAALDELVRATSR